MHRFILWYKAFFRIDLKAVCEMSKDWGPYDDYHDYPDAVHGFPWHFHEHTCKRCGKKFMI